VPKARKAVGPKSAAKEKLSLANLEAALGDILATLEAEADVGEKLRCLPQLEGFR
jgi:hypothetical protein